MQRKLRGLVFVDANSEGGIVRKYMEKLGFGNQPYLVYQHRDARHPHIYIATTNIEADGKRIDLHLGAKGRKDEKLNYRTAVAYIITNLLIYFFSCISLLVKIKITQQALLYMGLASTGFFWILSGGTLLSRIIQKKINNNDIFNKEKRDLSTGRKAPDQ